MNMKQLIGRRIKEIRKKRKMTQDKLAEKVDINPKYLSSIERGLENPTLNMLINLSSALNSDLDYIFNVDKIQEPVDMKKQAIELINQADENQLKLAFKVLSAIIS